MGIYQPTNMGTYQPEREKKKRTELERKAKTGKLDQTPVPDPVKGFSYIKRWPAIINGAKDVTSDQREDTEIQDSREMRTEEIEKFWG